MLTQFWVCLHAPLEPGDRFADHRIIQVANQPAQFSQTQPPRGPPKPERLIATPAAVPLREFIPALHFGPLQHGYNLLPTGGTRRSAKRLLLSRIAAGLLPHHFRRSRGSPALRRLISSMGARARPAAPIRSVLRFTLPAQSWLAGTLLVKTCSS
jgi:hypothetical protein